MLNDYEWRTILRECHSHSRARCLLAVNILSAHGTVSQFDQRIASKDIAEALAISKPAVHVLLDALQKEDSIFKEHYGRVVITPAGQKKAEYLKQHISAMTETISDRLETTMVESAFLAFDCVETMNEARLTEIENIGFNEKKDVITC